MSLISGVYDEQTWWGAVTMDGKRLTPRRSQLVSMHSPDGFSWGYSGSGPTQLALAILLEAGVPEADATALCFRFRDEFIARLPRASFVLTVNIEEWLGPLTGAGKREAAGR